MPVQKIVNQRDVTKEAITENKHLKDQIEMLAKYIMEKHPEAIKNEGACDTAIQIMKQQQGKIDGRKAKKTELSYKKTGQDLTVFDSRGFNIGYIAYDYMKFKYYFCAKKTRKLFIDDVAGVLDKVIEKEHEKEKIWNRRKYVRLLLSKV